MQAIQEELFEHDGATFKIRLFETDVEYKAAAYANGKQVTYFHDVNHETNFGFLRKFGVSYIPQLLQDIKDDISAGRFLV
ncbi:MAG: hypothetical protein WC216_01030 [Gallionella sp.]|jgi:hypothetical protein